MTLNEQRIRAIEQRVNNAMPGSSRFADLEYLQALMHDANWLIEQARIVQAENDKLYDLMGKEVSFSNLRLTQNAGAWTSEWSEEKTFASRFTPFITDLIVGYFKESKGVNYVTLNVEDEKEPAKYAVTIQKSGGKTPADRIEELQAEIEELKRATG